MHMCKAMRHKKQHFTFLKAEGKEENPDVGLSCPAAGHCGPINPGITPQRDEHQGENLRAQILKNTEAPDFAGDIGHPAALAARASSENSFSTPAGENLAPAANVLHSSQSKISSPISLETCQELPKPMKVKPEENKCPATSLLPCRGAE